jgi:hypothetical protein
MYLALTMTAVALLASGVHALSLTAPALAEHEKHSRAAEATAQGTADDGLPVPILAGGVVLAFAVGVAGGQVHRRRRAAQRRAVALERPAPVMTPPARPAPPPPETAAVAPQPVEIAPSPTAEPAPAPPAPEATPPRAVEFPAPPVKPAPKPPRRKRAPQPPHTADAPLGEAPEVPRPAEVAPAAEIPAPPLAQAPEAVAVPPSSEAPPEEIPAPGPGRRFGRVARWPEEAAALWTCEIDWKSGYLKSSFRAMAAAPGAAKRRPLAESAPVRWSLMGEPDPPTPELALRVRAMVEALEAAGWQHIGRGPYWYAQRFLWRGSGEPRPVTVPDTEIAER